METELDPAGTSAWSPPQIARRVEEVGVTKARLDLPSMLLLAVLAGAFIALGAALFLVAGLSSELGFGPTRLLSGAAFSLGLVLVVVAGAELFTGNNLIAMAWVSRRIGTQDLVRSWGVVYLGNVIGALLTALLLLLADVDMLHSGELGRAALAVARTKAELPYDAAFARGVLCNALVCLAVWLSIGGRSVADKVIGVLFPITAFVALGLEHSIANWFFFPYAAALDPEAGSSLMLGACKNLFWVSVGNVVGGTFLVAGIYWLAYLRSKPAPTTH